MLLSVVIPCHGGVDDTRACLRTLREQRDAGEIEIVLVDNASPDATSSLDAEFDAVRVLRQETNLGFAGGVNAGVAAARGELLLILNNDTLAAPHLVARLRRALLSDSRIGAAAPVSNHVKGPAWLQVGPAGRESAGRAALERALTDSWGGVLEDVDTLAGLCMLLRRETWQSVGPFDTRFGLGNFEDDDLCLRLRLEGHRLVLARDAFLHHRGHRTFDALGVDYSAQIDDRQQIFSDKWRGDPAGIATIAVLRGDGSSAAESSIAGLRTHPRWPDGHWWLGRRLAAKGRHHEAAEHLEAFVQQCPLHGAAQAELAFVRMATGAEEAGLRHLGWALRHCFYEDRALANVLGRLGERALHRGQPVRAVEWLRDAVGACADDGELHNLLGVALMELGQLEQALTCLETADGLDNHYALGNIGICQWRLGRPADALSTWKQAIDRRPDDANARQNLEAALGSLPRSPGGTHAPPDGEPATACPC